MGPNELYLPPLSSATVGILKPKPGADVTFTIWPTWQTVGADIAFYVLGQVQNLPIEKGFNSVIKGGVGACYAIGPETALTSVTVASIHDYFKEIADCIENAFSFDVAAGIMNDVQVGQLESWYGTIKNAKELGTGLLVADVIWKVGDFVSDAILRDLPRGNGFEVQAVSGSNPPPPPPPTPTPTPTTPPQGSNPPPTPTPTPTTPSQGSNPPPTPTPAPPPPPQTWAETAGGVAHTWTNYQNAGGYQGQSVAQYQTIQIACKITGFVVADGNPWWYRIAQTPGFANAFLAGFSPGRWAGRPFHPHSCRACALFAAFLSHLSAISWEESRLLQLSGRDRWKRITEHLPCCPSARGSPSCHRWGSLAVPLYPPLSGG